MMPNGKAPVLGTGESRFDSGPLDRGFMAQRLAHLIVAQAIPVRFRVNPPACPRRWTRRAAS